MTIYIICYFIDDVFKTTLYYKQYIHSVVIPTATYGVFDRILIHSQVAIYFEKSPCSISFILFCLCRITLSIRF